MLLALCGWDCGVPWMEAKGGSRLYINEGVLCGPPMLRATPEAPNPRRSRVLAASSDEEAGGVELPPPVLPIPSGSIRPSEEEPNVAAAAAAESCRWGDFPNSFAGAAAALAPTEGLLPAPINCNCK